jgi:hypothetical protein
MPSDQHAVCTRCGGQAVFRATAAADAKSPAFRVYTCDDCGNLMWLNGQPDEQWQKRTSGDS